MRAVYTSDKAGCVDVPSSLFRQVEQFSARAVYTSDKAGCVDGPSSV